MMIRYLESYFLDLIKGRKKGFLAAIFRSALYLLSWPFRLLVAGRNCAFDREWVSRYYPPVPVVISVGNIVVGGTGKTPATMLLAEEFYQEFLIAILSRGYRSPAEKLSSPVVLSMGNGPLQSAAFCGDEPYLLAQNLPKALVFVGKDRHQASDMAAKAGAHLILLDDGMQHRRLARDVEVIVMDAGDPFGQGYFLPRGLLREGIKSLARAHLIIVNHIGDGEAFLEMKRQIERYSAAIVVGTRMEVVQALDFDGHPLPTLAGKKVGVFCGIAHPEYFQDTVRQLGAEIVANFFTADHLAMEPYALAEFSAQCKKKGAELLLCTEKDRVKILNVNNLPLPVAWIKMRLRLVEGEQEWHAFIEKTKADLRRRI